MKVFLRTLCILLLVIALIVGFKIMDESSSLPFDDDTQVISIDAPRLIVHVSSDGKGETVEGMRIELLDLKERQLLSSSITNQKGQVSFDNLKLGTTYLVRHIDDKGNTLVSQPATLRLTRSNCYVTVKAPEFVKAYSFVNGKMVYDELVLPVDKLLQMPELPNGCEITALTSLLNTLGINVDKVTLSNDYLIKVLFYSKGGKTYGGYPENEYAGDPSHYTGWYVYENPIRYAGNKFLEEKGANLEVKAIEKLSETTIDALLEDGKAIALWATIDYEKAHYAGGWYLSTGAYYKAISNVHCVVVYGYDKDSYYIMNPLKGYEVVEKERLLEAAEELGNRAIYIEEKK